MAEKVVRAAVEVRRRHDVIALRRQVGDGDENRRHAGGNGNGSHAAVKGGDALLIGGVRRVLKTGVDVSCLAEFEKACRMVAVLETVCRSRVNGYAARAGLILRVESGVNLPRGEF